MELRNARELAQHDVEVNFIYFCRTSNDDVISTVMLVSFLKVAMRCAIIPDHPGVTTVASRTCDDAGRSVRRCFFLLVTMVGKHPHFPIPPFLFSVWRIAIGQRFHYGAKCY